jgi:hypothetical protein
VDASEVGVGAVLSQHTGTPTKLQPCFKLLSPAQRNLDVVDRELLAVKKALKGWKQWLEGSKHPFLVWTYHRNPEYIRAVKKLNPRQARWALFFARFQFTVSYRPGSKNVKADTLSRLNDVGRGNPHYPSAPYHCTIGVGNERGHMAGPAQGTCTYTVPGEPCLCAYVPTGVRDCQHLGIQARPGTSGFGTSGVGTINWPTTTALRRLFFLQATWSGSPPSACPAGS